MNAKALRLTAFAAASLCLIASSPAQDDASLIDLESVVVKGSRSDQLLLDTPNSITIIDRQTIQESGITNLRDIDDFAPNVSINQIGQVGGNFISIRGIESNPFIVNRTAVYIDGIPFREPDTVNIRNAEQIEILRGPQSTLYGASANAGILVVNTRPPQHQPTSEIYGGFNLFEDRGAYSVGAYISGGLSQDLTGSLSLDMDKGDSYVKNIASSIGEEGEIEDLALYGKLRYQPREENQLNVSVFFNKLRAPGLYEQEFPGLDIDTYNALYGQTFNGGLEVGEFEQANDAPKFTREEEYGLGASYRQDFGSIRMELAGTYRKVDDQSQGTDLDLTASPLAAGATVLDEEFWNLETRFYNDPEEDGIQWLLGLSFYSQDRDRILSTLSGPGGLDDYNPAPPQALKNEDQSIFAQLIIPISDKLDLTAGVRYEEFESTNSQEEGVLDLGPGFPPFTFPALSRAISGDIFLPKLAVSYEIDEGKQLFFSAAKGHLPGGYNLVAAENGADIDQAFGPYDPEEIWSYEIGSKLRLLDGKLYASAAVFYIDAGDWQEVNVLTAPDGSVLSTALISTDAAVESKGFEMELQRQVNDRLALKAGIGYTHSEYARYDFSTVDDYSGNKVKLIPEYDIVLIANYKLNDKWSAQAKINALGETRLNAENTSTRGTINLLDLSLRYQAENWSCRLFAENVANKRYAVGQAYENFLFGSDGIFYSPLGSPRIFGVEFNYQLR